mmetsp:Transcript_39181/g.94144  ORF Transcript_39181/g.94144 Transcript_39181/m.94144 type:complete len:255 (+) Transcript_39181:431-1195(+)
MGKQRVIPNPRLTRWPREVAPPHIIPHVDGPTVLHLPTSSLAVRSIQTQRILIQHIHSNDHPITPARSSPPYRAHRLRACRLHSEATVSLHIRRHLRRGDVLCPAMVALDLHEPVPVLAHGGVLPPATGAGGGARHGHGHFVDAGRCARVEVWTVTAGHPVANQHHLILVDEEHSPRDEQPINSSGVGEINRMIMRGHLGGHRGRHAIPVLHSPCGTSHRDDVRVIVGVSRVGPEAFTIRGCGAVVRRLTQESR